VNRNRCKSYVQKRFKAISTILLSLMLTACASNNTLRNEHHSPRTNPSGLVCQSPERFKGRVVGDGHCVSLIKRCTQAPLTAQWRPGNKVIDSNILPGTVIATFKNGRYPNVSGHHAAIFIKQDKSGIWVWDQWLGKPVHQRLIRRRPLNESTPGNTAQFYRVVKLAKP